MLVKEYRFAYTQKGVANGTHPGLPRPNKVLDNVYCFIK